MRKNVLSLSIAAMIGGLGFAGVASAGIAYEAGVLASNKDVVNGVDNLSATNATKLVVSAKGVGHNLLTPYYSVQNGNGTLLSIVNTDTYNGKAVKVRFRGASNSDDVFDFTVLLSPGDVWTANVYKDDVTGLARLYTPDNSCTLPRRSELNSSKQLFKTDRVNPALSGDALAAETREGYVEIFNMADIPPKVPANGTKVDASVTGTDLIANPLYTAIKHGTNGQNPCGSTADGAPLPAAVLALREAPGVTNILGVAGADDTDPNKTKLLKHGLWTPSTGLMGSWTILNQSSGFVSWSANMVAVEARNDADAAARGRIVFSPQMDTPVAGANVNKLTADPLLRTDKATNSVAVIAAAAYDLPDMSTPYLVTNSLALTAANGAVGQVGGAANATLQAAGAPVIQAAKLTGALAVQSVMNEYVTNPLINAQTDWVFSMPTRRYAVGVNYTAATKPAAVFNTLAAQEVVDGTVQGNGTTAATVTENAGNAVSRYFTAANTKMGLGGSSGDPIYQACVEPKVGGNSVVAYDQEEGSASSDFVVSPGTAKRVKFCGEVSVLTVNSTASLGAVLTKKDIITGFSSGWMNIGTPGNSDLGLPVIGHSFVKMTGAPAAGKSTNYSITQEHRYK